MNCKINFFTPVTFKNQEKSPFDSCLETIDSYFYLGGKKAFVSTLTPSLSRTKKVVLSHDSTSIWATAAKVVSYASLVLPLIMLTGKAVLRRKYTFETIDLQQHLTQIKISPELIKKVEDIFIQGNIAEHLKVLEQKQTITSYPSNFNIIFTFNENPDFIFKATIIRKNLHTPLLPDRLKKMIAAEEIRLAYNLDRLIIPRAQEWLLEIKDSQLVLIAEEKFDIQTDYYDQEELYRSLDGLDEAIRQLAFFIAKTGFSDVDHRNIPIITDHEGQKRIVLVDLEEMNGAEEGIYGSAFLRKGLISCLGSEEHINLVLQEASRLGVFYRSSNPTKTAADIKRKRLEQLQLFKGLDEFYQKRQLLADHDQKIPENYLELGLNPEEKIFIHGRDKPPITMQQAIQEVVSAINRSIETSAACSIRAKRMAAFNLFAKTPVASYFYYLDEEHPIIDNPTREQNTLLYRICRALKEKNHIFNYFFKQGIFIIQA